MTAGQALQAALAVEHQVVYGYGVAGARLRGIAQRDALRRLDEHSALRDEIAAMTRRAGLSPVVAAPAYRTPFPVADPAAALRLLALLEDSAAGAAWDVVAAAGAATAARRLGVGALAAAAAAGQQWRLAASAGQAPALPPALPGQPT